MRAKCNVQDVLENGDRVIYIKKVKLYTKFHKNGQKVACDKDNEKWKLSPWTNMSLNEFFC